MHIRFLRYNIELANSMTPQLFGLSYVYEYALLPSWTLALYFSNWLIIGTTAAAINGHIFVGALACHISYVEIDIALGFSFLIGGMLVTPPVCSHYTV